MRSTMKRSKGTTPKAVHLKMNREGSSGNNGGGESFRDRVLYYGDASAGSVPFMWESHPGTPKHPTTHSSLPPLTPPPAYTSLGNLFLATKTPPPPPPTSLRTLFLASSSRRANVAPSHSSLSCSLPSSDCDKEFRHFVVEEDGDVKRQVGGGSPTSTLCFGAGFMKVYRMKKVKNALMSIATHGKAD